MKRSRSVSATRAQRQIMYNVQAHVCTVYNIAYDEYDTIYC